MSGPKRKLRSTLSQKQQQRPQGRSSGRQIKPAATFGRGRDATAEERALEKRQRETERQRRKRERRLDELERGQASTAGWNENSTSHIPAASTTAAAIAGLLAGKQAERADAFDDLGSAATGTSTPTTGGTSSKKKQSADLKRLLHHRRGLRALLEDASSSSVFTSAPINFLTALDVPHRYPLHRANAPLCSVCGYWGDAVCVRCGDRICSIACTTTHDETRCERPL